MATTLLQEAVSAVFAIRQEMEAEAAQSEADKSIARQQHIIRRFTEELKLDLAEPDSETRAELVAKGREIPGNLFEELAIVVSCPDGVAIANFNIIYEEEVQTASIKRSLRCSHRNAVNFIAS